MSPRMRLLVASLSTGIIFYVAVGSVLGRVLGDTTYGQLTVFNEVIRMVIDSYVEPVNLDRAMGGAYVGLTEALDGDSAYLDAEDFAALAEPARDDASLGLVLTRRYSFLMIVGTRPGSPARQAGVRTGDLIKTIDGRHSRYISVPVAERMLRGEPGSTVKLELHRAGTDLVSLDVVRERVTATPVHREVLAHDVGYLQVPEFSSGTADEVRSQMQTLARSGVERLVVDVRGSAWGPVEQGVDVAGLFFDGGAVARVDARHNPPRVLQAPKGPPAWPGPVAVITDLGTAGAGEILAAAIRERSRGSVVGVATFGRAPILRRIPLPSGGLLLTVAKWTSPEGTPIHGRGVEPTETVEAVASKDGDPALDRAIELLAATTVRDKAA